MPPANLTPPHESIVAPSGAPLTRGSSIGRYVVLGLVGRGGMGEVYAAYDPELDRKVAVKLLRVKPGNGVSLTEGRQRTLREAQAIARLSHPNVVVVVRRRDLRRQGLHRDGVRRGEHRHLLAGAAAADLARDPRASSWPPGAGLMPRTKRGWSTATSSPTT